MDPLFSIIIVTFNGYDFVSACVASIQRNIYQATEIIVVDNASTDGSAAKLKEQFGDDIIVVCLDKNYGPSLARNKGVAASSGTFLGFLDNDTEVDPNWIVEAKQLFDEDSRLGILQCKLLLYSDRTKIDYAGEYLGQNGFLVHVAEAGVTDQGQFDDTGLILAAKSAGMFIRREAFDAAGGFDPDYFIMVEETDLGWRNWLVGYTARFAPRSRVFHHFSTSFSILGKAKASYNARFHGTKNYICTLIKNLEFLHLLVILPQHILIWIGFSCFMLATGRHSEASHVVKALFWNVTHLRTTLYKRNLVQRMRIINDRSLFKIILRRQSFIVKAISCLKGLSVLRSMGKDIA